MMRINIYTTGSKTAVDRVRVRRLIRKVLRDEDKKVDTVNVIAADDAYLQQLNETYFHRKKTTNVISFDLGGTVEVYVSEQQARDDYELHYYILHGLLHAIGYDHRTKKEERLMNKKCQEYLSDE